MSYWRTEYDDGWWTFYKDGIEIKFDNPNFGDLIVDEINNANLRIAELEAQQCWIPVSERLPEGRTVLVFKKEGSISIDTTYIDGGNYFWWKSGQSKVTHWMPIPQPPEVK